jgi:hypothetical protein
MKPIEIKLVLGKETKGTYRYEISEGSSGKPKRIMKPSPLDVLSLPT